MESLKEASGVRKRARIIGPLRCCWWICPVIGFLMLFGSSHGGWALQHHTLTAGQGEEESEQKHQASPEGGGEKHPAVLPSLPGAASSQEGAGHAPGPQGLPHAPESSSSAPKGHEGQKQLPAVPAHPEVHAPAAAGHEAATEHDMKPEGAHEEHGPPLPKLSPIPGVTFVETMINLMDRELHGRFLGWRPNDILIGRFTDDINNYQLGVLEAIRFTTLRLKDSLTRMGDADTYDRDLEEALNLFMNSSTRFWLPSAESQYDEALDHLRNFLQKLKTGKRNFYYRKDNLTLLLGTYRDLLGNVNKNLVAGDVSWFKTDDYFYYAKGVAHVYYEILRVVRVGYESQLASTINAKEIMDEILHELHRAEEMDPWIVLDGKLDGFFANHRANLNAPASEVAHLLVVMSQL